MDAVDENVLLVFAKKTAALEAQSTSMSVKSV